jgi:uncharacterized phage-associated protein
MKRAFDYKKATQAINFFVIREGGVINKMKALKLLWLADRFHLRMYGRSISNDDYLAMKLGPVPSLTKNIVENYHTCPLVQVSYGQRYISQNKEDKYFLDTVATVDLKVFSKTDLQALECVYSQFGSKSQYELSDISHAYPEWTRWEEALKTNPKASFSITEADFFEPSNPKVDPLFDELDDRIRVNCEQYFEIPSYESYELA